MDLHIQAESGHAFALMIYRSDGAAGRRDE